MCRATCKKRAASVYTSLLAGCLFFLTFPGYNFVSVLRKYVGQKSGSIFGTTVWLSVSIPFWSILCDVFLSLSLPFDKRRRSIGVGSECMYVCIGFHLLCRVMEYIYLDSRKKNTNRPKTNRQAAFR
jgi:hypothetical protein